MAPQSLKRYYELTDNGVNGSSLTPDLKHSSTLKSTYLKKQLGISPEFKILNPLKLVKVRRRSQNRRKSKRSGDGADGRKMLFHQALVLPQKTAGDGHFQESNQDVYPRIDLLVDTTFHTTVLGRPQLQRQICENGQDCTMDVPRRILNAFRQLYPDRVIPELQKKNKVRTKRRHQADQKEYRRCSFLESSGCKVLDDERHLKPSNMNVSRPVSKYFKKNPDNCLMPSQNYQPIVSPVAYPAKSPVTGQHSFVDLHGNRMDFAEQEVVKNLGQPESFCPTSAANWIVENASCKYSTSIPSHSLMPSQNYQPMVSQIAHPVKSCMIGQLSTVNPHGNYMDFAEQEVVKNLGQPESCFPTSAADWKLKNEPSRPTLKGSRRRGSRLKGESPAQLQKNLEYLERWATESTFMEEIERITETLKKKGFPFRVPSPPIIFSNDETSSRGESQFHDLPPTNFAGADERSSPEPSSSSLSEYNPHYSPISP